MAKDVSTFLSWAAEPEHDERKKIGIKAVILFSTLTIYVKRFKWTVIKNRKIGESRNSMLMADQVWLNLHQSTILLWTRLIEERKDVK
jgi:hypothetical protein